MPNDFWIVIALGVIALIVVCTILFSKRSGGAQRSKAKVKGPFGLTLNTESSSEVTPGIRMDDVTSEEGQLSAEDKTGRGVHAKKVRTKGDITFTNVAPPDSGQSPDPKT